MRRAVTEVGAARVLAGRMRHIQPFHVMALLARARQLESQGRSIIHMEIGEPDFVSPAPVIEAGRRALANGRTHYTPALGLPELRGAIAEHYHRCYGTRVDLQRVIVTPGASGALLLVVGVVVSPGAEVLMADPGYPCNRHFVRMLEGAPVGIPVGPETGYQLTAELVANHWSERTVAVMVSTPANPTGTILPPAELQAIVELAQVRGGWVIVDEIYHGLVYGREPVTAAGLSEGVFVVNSFSKYFGMTGWRIGWLVAPQECVEPVDRLAQNIFLAPSTVAQWGALEALAPASVEILEARRREFRTRRDFLLPALRGLGFDIPVTPQGAFYLYADIHRFADDSYRFAEDLLDRIGVAVTPGIDFGRNAPERHVRFAYTTGLEQLREGVRRLQGLLRPAR